MAFVISYAAIMLMVIYDGYYINQLRNRVKILEGCESRLNARIRALEEKE